MTSPRRNHQNSSLAVFGGEPVRRKRWPVWPQASKIAEQYLRDVLHSGRWGIGGKYNGIQTFEHRFASAFSGFNNSLFCVPTTSGSTALVIALESLGVGFGDEVIVPALVWISCATAVLRLGAVPILVDIESKSLCISPNAVKAAITDRTKAILVVHSYCTVANMDALIQLSTKTGVPLVEDCSQAHGTIWKKRRVGTLGKIGIFSMGNSKVLTCGEGGAAITDDPVLYEILQQLRGEGFRYKDYIPKLGESQLEEAGLVQGYNHCLSEFQSAILLSGLKTLDFQNKKREANGDYLRVLCQEIGSLTPLTRDPAIDSLTYFRFCVRFELNAFGGATIEQVRKALMVELNESSIELVDYPLDENPLYHPLQSRYAKISASHRKRLNAKRFDFPEAKKAYNECITFHHAMLLGTKGDMEDIAMAVLKLKKNSRELLNVQ